MENMAVYHQLQLRQLQLHLLWRYRGFD